MAAIRIKGQFAASDISRHDADAILSALESRLRSLKATNVERHGDTVSFAVPLLRFAGSWDALAAVDRGLVGLSVGSPGLVTYEVSCERMAVIVAVAVASMALVIAVGQGGMTAVDFAFLSVAWPFVFGLNYLIALVRVPYLVRSAVDSVPRGSDVRHCPTCGNRYRASDYDVAAEQWVCESCQRELPRR